VQSLPILVESRGTALYRSADIPRVLVYPLLQRRYHFTGHQGFLVLSWSFTHLRLVFFQIWKKPPFHPKDEGKATVKERHSTFLDPQMWPLLGK
jgi:hypothetical protein